MHVAASLLTFCSRAIDVMCGEDARDTKLIARMPPSTRASLADRKNGSSKNSAGGQLNPVLQFLHKTQQLTQLIVTTAYDIQPHHTTQDFTQESWINFLRHLKKSPT